MRHIPTLLPSWSVALSTAALLALGSGQAQADTPYYLGGSLGSTSWRGPVNGIDGSDSGTGYKVYGGWQLTPNYALELSSVRLGSQQDANGNEARARGYGLDGVGLLPLGQGFSLLGRVGLADLKTVTSTGSDRGMALKIGGGLQYQLSQSTALRAEWERYRLSAYSTHTNADQFTLGVKFGF
ncbi:porin family protein [Aquabacterium sp. OR-4]|uniref:porin family protein n=1 Tax=Aquabacterium sp. OR-4 TaxID=2978127 RepID=UPI0021B3ED43|nr:porin family protein [Aquabacterium sp. OR-4]MDT7834576.1 porin family protein [Aquabacterium sp. OR-4]